MRSGPPPSRFARVVLLAGALAFAGPGAGFLLAPERFAAAVDVALHSPTAASDVRSVFGGLELGLAAAFASAALVGRALVPSLSILLCALGGMLAGRAIGLALDGPPGPLAWLLGAIEAALFAAALVALRDARR